MLFLGSKEEARKGEKKEQEQEQLALLFLFLDEERSL
jgi:hypothetical protein